MFLKSQVLTLFRMWVFRAAHRGVGAKMSPALKSVTCPTMMKLGSYTLPKEDPKNI